MRWCAPSPWVVRWCASELTVDCTCFQSRPAPRTIFSPVSGAYWVKAGPAVWLPNPETTPQPPPPNKFPLVRIARSRRPAFWVLGLLWACVPPARHSSTLTPCRLVYYGQREAIQPHRENWRRQYYQVSICSGRKPGEVIKIMRSVRFPPNLMPKLLLCPPDLTVSVLCSAVLQCAHAVI